MTLVRSLVILQAQVQKTTSISEDRTDSSGTATISITSDTFTDVAGNPNSESSDVTLEVDSFPFSVTSSEHVNVNEAR